MFGCRAFVHVPRDERTKLDGKSKECIFLGYACEEFGYRLWDPVDKKIIRSRDVIFFEDQTIEDIKKKVETKQTEEYPVNLELVPLPANQNEGGAGEDDANEPPIVQPNLRRSARGQIESRIYPSDEYVTLTEGGEPECYEEAISGEHKEKWTEAMQEEMKSLQDNNTFKLVQLPKGKRALKNKWVFKLKYE